MKKKILLISGDFPYPLNHGDRVDVFERIKTLHSLGFKITLISTVKRQPSKLEIDYMYKFCNEVFLINRINSFYSFISILPFQVKSRLNKVDIERILNIINNKEFSFTFLQGHYVLSLFLLFSDKVKTKKLYLRVNNDEAVYFKELSNATEPIIKKIFYRLESFKFKFYEAYMFKHLKIDKLLHVSYDEYKKYTAKFRELEHLFLPVSLNINDIKKFKSKNNKNVLFIGSLFMPNNLEGLKWFLNKVHNNILNEEPSYKLIIAGNTIGVNLEELNSFFSAYRNIFFVPSPEDLDVLYEGARVFINPMLSGAGVKVKTINAIKEGLPVVSTIIGNEGTGMIDQKEIFVTNDPKTFKEYIILLLNNENKCKSLVFNSQKKLVQEYDQKRNLKDILNGNLK